MIGVDIVRANIREAKQAAKRAKQVSEEAKQATERTKRVTKEAKQATKQANLEAEQARQIALQTKQASKQAKQETKQAKQESKQAKRETKQVAKQPAGQAGPKPKKKSRWQRLASSAGSNTFRKGILPYLCLFIALGALIGNIIHIVLLDYTGIVNKESSCWLSIVAVVKAIAALFVCVVFAYQVACKQNAGWGRHVPFLLTWFVVLVFIMGGALTIISYGPDHLDNTWQMVLFVSLDVIGMFACFAFLWYRCIPGDSVADNSADTLRLNLLSAILQT